MVKLVKSGALWIALSTLMFTAYEVVLKFIAGQLNSIQLSLCRFTVGFVILLPLFLVDFIGQGEPFFCKLICPAGTLEGGIPMVLLNEPLRATIGWLYTWKMAILAVLIFLSILTYRPFCKYLCPLGAVYGLANPVSFYKLRVDEEKCIHCGKCAKVCPMQVDPVKSPNALECIRCGECKKACPTGAISMGFGARVSAKKMIGIDLPEMEKKS